MNQAKLAKRKSIAVLTPSTPPAAGAAAAAARARTALLDAGPRPGATHPGRPAGAEGPRRAVRAALAESSTVASMAVQPGAPRGHDWVGRSEREWDWTADGCSLAW
jgi:hypothetical protein